MISIGESIEISILSILIVKELSVRDVIVKSANAWYSKVVTKLVASRFVYPD